MLVLLLPGMTYSQLWEERDLPYPFIYTNSPVNAGEDLVLTVFSGTSWVWAGPNNFTSFDDFIIIPSASINDSGTYYVTVYDTIYDTTIYLSEYINVKSVNSSCIVIYDDYSCI
ncbi:MAG: hypothetical protein AB9842_00670 [Bacteroidales bacterium]